MHIPTADTDTLELLPFQEALEKSGQRGDYDAARWLYVPDFYTEYRYILGTRGEKPLVCAYNAQFDLCFLFYFLHRLGCAEVLKKAQFLDIMAIYKDRRDYPHKLCNAVEAYGVDGVNTHRAVDDANAALEVLLAMEQERGDIERYINLFGYNPKYGVPKPKIGSVRYEPQPYQRQKLLYE